MFLVGAGTYFTYCLVFSQCPHELSFTPKVATMQNRGIHVSAVLDVVLCSLCCFAEHGPPGNLLYFTAGDSAICTKSLQQCFSLCLKL